MDLGAPKIFGIGLSKTGTSSLARALEILGYRTRDYPGIERYLRGDVTSVDLEVVDAHDALTDTPIPSFYRELDARYPGSKFVLTVRERQGWLLSCKKQFTERLAAKQNDAHRQLFVDLYGTDVFDEEKLHPDMIASFRTCSRISQDALRTYWSSTSRGRGVGTALPFSREAGSGGALPQGERHEIRWIDISEVVAGGARCWAGSTACVATPSFRQAPGAGPNARGPRPLRCPSFQVSSTEHGAPFTAGMWRGNKGACQGEGVHRALHKLAPQIPVLARGGEVTPYVQRATWNHYG